jgi:hypothetical protein
MSAGHSGASIGPKSSVAAWLACWAMDRISGSSESDIALAVCKKLTRNSIFSPEQPKSPAKNTIAQPKPMLGEKRE